MKNTAFLQLTAKYQLTQTAAVLGATMLLPVLVHLLPNMNGNLSGAVLIPIFFAPLVAVFLYKKHVALLAGVFAPLLNYLFLGRPAPEMVVALGFELVTFVLILNLLKEIKVIRHFAAPLAYLIATFLVIMGMSALGSLQNPFAFWMNTTLVAAPGILIMTLINLAILKFRR